MAIVTTLRPAQNIATVLSGPAVTYDNDANSAAAISLNTLFEYHNLEGKDCCVFISDKEQISSIGLQKSVPLTDSFELFVFNDFSALLCDMSDLTSLKVFYFPLRIGQCATTKNSKILITMTDRQSFMMQYQINSDLRKAVLTDINAIKKFWNENPVFDTTTKINELSRLVWCLPNTAMAGFEADFDNEVWAAVSAFEAMTQSKVEHIVVNLRSFGIAGQATDIECKALAQYGAATSASELDFCIRAQLDDCPRIPVSRQIASGVSLAPKSKNMRFIGPQTCNSHDIIRAHRRIMAAKEADTNLH